MAILCADIFFNTSQTSQRWSKFYRLSSSAKKLRSNQMKEVERAFFKGQ